MMYRPQYLEEPESTYEKYWSHNGYLPVQHTRIILWSGYKRKQNHEVVPFRGRRKPKTPKSKFYNTDSRSIGYGRFDI